MAITGHLDEATRQSLRGWAWDPAHPDDSVELQVLVDGQHAASVIANAFRPDLNEAGIGNGRHGFSLDGSALVLPLTATVVHVQGALAGEKLIGSPVRLEAPLELDGPVRQAMVALLESPGSDPDLRERVQFLADQADRLLQRLANSQSNRHARAVARSRKWRWERTDRPEPQSPCPRALVMDHCIPAVGRDAGSNAIRSHMLSLQRLGFEITFVPIDLHPDTHADVLRTCGIAVACAPWNGSVEEVLRRQTGEFDLVYLHRVEVAHRYLHLVRHYLPKARIIFSVADLHHLRLARQIKVEDRPEAVAYVNQVRMQELSAASACHAVITHSAFEAALLRKALPRANVFTVPWAVPPCPSETSFAERSGVGFLGNYSHAPNRDAAIWLADEIMPMVWQRAPDIRCLLAGCAMPDMLKSGRDPRIVPLGLVADLSQLFGQIRSMVAPLAYGAGLKGKVADSLAAGVPCVCTPVAAEGFALPEPLRAFVAGDAAGLADAIIRLHDDEAAFQTCRMAGLAFVQQAFSEAAVDAGLRQAAGLPAA